LVKKICRVIQDEKGISMVETLIITGALAATAVLALSAYRSGASNAASIVSRKAVSTVTSGTSW